MAGSKENQPEKQSSGLILASAKVAKFPSLFSKENVPERPFSASRLSETSLWDCGTCAHILPGPLTQQPSALCNWYHKYGVSLRKSQVQFGEQHCFLKKIKIKNNNKISHSWQ